MIIHSCLLDSFGDVSNFSVVELWNLKSLTVFFCCFPLQDWSGQDISSIASEICGFITVLTGTIILHGTKEQEESTRKGIGQHVTFNQFPCVCLCISRISHEPK